MTLRPGSPRAKPRWGALAGVIAVIGTLSAGIALAIPSNFVEVDGDFNIRHSATGTYDWANSGPNRTVSAAGVVTVNGSGGIWDGGVQSGSNNIPPTAPIRTAAALADAEIIDADFIVDPLSSDNTACGNGADPTTFAGAGSETNGGLISSFTWGNAGNTPPKNDLSNVYAISREGDGKSEVFFGAERVVNNGDSHIDFEFLQSAVMLTGANLPCGPGGFTGDRTQGDFLLAIDFTQGGELGGSSLYRWQCDATYSAANDGNVCNPPAHGKSVPHYEIVTNATVIASLKFGVNSGETPIAGGGWVHRNSDGSPRSDVIKNAFMEGAIDLGALGFTGCVQTLLPHTRSSQSFTAVLKDFTIVSFDTCRAPGIATQVRNTNDTPSALDDTNVDDGATITPGETLYDTATLSGSTANAGGTVDYYYQLQDPAATEAECDDGTSLGQKTVLNAVVPASDTVTLTTPGTYEFWADYSGDAKNDSVTSTCGAETVVVAKFTPTITTIIKDVNDPEDTEDDTTVADDGSVTIPSTLYDTSSLSGATSDAGGTVDYYYQLQDPAATEAECDDGTSLGQVAVTDGSVPNSNTVELDQAGTYEFWAVYSGDDNNNGDTSVCGAETVVVLKNSPTIASQPDGQIRDSATVSGLTSDATGTIIIRLFAPTNATCDVGGAVAQSSTWTIGFDATVETGSVGPLVTNWFTVSANGTWRYVVYYSGDSNNEAQTSGCNDETVNITITPAPSS